MFGWLFGSSKPHTKASIKNAVTIRVWRSKNAEKGSSFGHATLQTHMGGTDGKGIYASFWPRDRITSLFFTRRQGYLATLQRDLKELEKRQPDVEINLHGLDIQKINTAFEEFRASDCDWELWGSTYFKSKNTRNCSGLTHHLLQIGRIDKFVGTYTGTGFRTGIYTGVSGGIGAGLLAANNMAVVYGAGTFAAPAGLATMAGISAMGGPLVFAATAGIYGILYCTVLSAATITTGTIIGKNIELMRNSVITPDRIADIAREAQQNERKYIYSESDSVQQAMCN